MRPTKAIFVEGIIGSGKPFFAGPRPPLRLKASERMDEDVIRLAYIPA